MTKHTQQFVGNLPTNCLSVFHHFVGLALEGLNSGLMYRFKHWLVLVYFYMRVTTDQMLDHA